MSTRSYFGYGERTPQVMEAIIGRVPEYDTAILGGFRLFVQRTVDMTPAVREIMAINRLPDEMENLQVYAAKQAEGAHMPGVVYRDVTDQESKLLDNFDIEGLWFQRFRNRFINIVNDDGVKTRLGDADYHANPSGELVVPAAQFDGIFPPALSDPLRTLEIARSARERFLS